MKAQKLLLAFSEALTIYGLIIVGTEYWLFM